MVIINAIMGLKGGKAEAQLGICLADVSADLLADFLSYERKSVFDMIHHFINAFFHTVFHPVDTSVIDHAAP